MNTCMPTDGSTGVRAFGSECDASLTLSRVSVMHLTLSLSLSLSLSTTVSLSLALTLSTTVCLSLTSLNHCVPLSLCARGQIRQAAYKAQRNMNEKEEEQTWDLVQEV